MGTMKKKIEALFAEFLISDAIVPPYIILAEEALRVAFGDALYGFDGFHRTNHRRPKVEMTQSSPS